MILIGGIYLLFHTVPWYAVLKYYLMQELPRLIINIIYLIDYSFVLLFLLNNYSIFMKLNNNLNIDIIYLNIIYNIVQKVKRSIRRGIFACICRYIHQRLNIIGSLINKKNISTFEVLKKNKYVNSNKTPFNFNEWLVGLTDGDGCFNIYVNKSNKKISFKLKISQSIYNTQLIYYLKKELGIGCVNQSGNMIDYVVNNQKDIIKYILPIFDKYPLLTSKEFNYLRFKEAILINNNDNISKLEKLNLILELKKKEIPSDYIASSWNVSNIDILNIDISNIDVENIMTRSWLAGFIEAEGSFYLVSKSIKPLRIVHGFGITQKLDKIVLCGIKNILNIKSNVLFHKNFYKLDTTNSSNIEYIINYFINNDHKNIFKGVKSYEFTVWKRSYFKFKDNSEKLLKIREQIRNIKKIN